MIHITHILKLIFYKTNVVYIYIKMVYNYYQKNKQKFQKEAHERYQNLSEEEK